MNSFLYVENLQVNYGRLVAVRDVSLCVERGEAVCIVGPNGAGKTTTLMAIAGAVTSVRGTIFFDGRDIVGVPTEKIVRRGISLVPEGRHIFTRLTVGENLRLATHIRTDHAAARRDFDRVVEYFPVLKQRLTSPAGRLSGGEQQQLAIARALLTRPKLMLVDEPSLGLAPLIVNQVYEALLRLREEGLTLLIVEQSLDRALLVADRLYVFRNGNVQLAGTGAELSIGSAAEEAYFGFSRVGETPS